jgi:hypothetical protein
MPDEIIVRDNTIIHNFDRSLKHQAQHHPCWRKIYEAVFADPIKTTISYHGDKVWDVERGIDRAVVFNNGKRKYIDEKVRWDYWPNRRTGGPDILLEYWSDEERRIDGWLTKKGCEADFLAYLIAPEGRAYVMPWEKLVRAFQRHGPRWIEENPSLKYPDGLHRSPNRDGSRRWNSVWVPVPEEDILKAVEGAMCLTVDKFTIDESIALERRLKNSTR